MLYCMTSYLNWKKTSQSFQDVLGIMLPFLYERHKHKKQVESENVTLIPFLPHPNHVSLTPHPPFHGTQTTPQKTVYSWCVTHSATHTYMKINITKQYTNMLINGTIWTNFKSEVRTPNPHYPPSLQITGIFKNVNSANGEVLLNIPEHYGGCHVLRTLSLLEWRIHINYCNTHHH